MTMTDEIPKPTDEELETLRNIWDLAESQALGGISYNDKENDSVAELRAYVKDKITEDTKKHWDCKDHGMLFSGCEICMRRREKQAVDKAMRELRKEINDAMQGYDVACTEFGGGDLSLGRLRMCEDVISTIDAKYPNARKEEKKEVG